MDGRARFALAAALLLLPLSAQAHVGSGAHNHAPVVQSFTVADASIDLIDDNGGTIHFVLWGHAGNNSDGLYDKQSLGDAIADVDLLFEGPGDEEFTFAPMHRNDTSTQANADPVTEWVGDVLVDDTRLVTGDWTVTPVVVDSFGLASSGPPITLTVAADSPPDFDLGINGIEPVSGNNYAPQDIGPGDSLQADIGLGGDDFLLRTLTYHFLTSTGATKPLPLDPPYWLTSDRFPQGHSTLVIEGKDRTGRSRTINVPVDVDTFAPVAAVTVPNTTYQGVPFEVTVAVYDSSPYEVTVLLGNESQSEAGEGGAGEHMFTIVRGDVGNASILVRVADDFGNSVVSLHPTETLVHTADTYIKSIDQVGGPAFRDDTVKVRTVLSQHGGVGIVPVDVSFRIDGGTPSEQQGEITAPDGTLQLDLERDLPPGRYNLTVTVTPQAPVVESNGSDQTSSFLFDVFLGTVTYEDAQYYMRADGRGFPLEIVDGDGGVYNVTLKDQGSRQVYAFTAGGVDLYWDPEQPDTVVTSAGPAGDNGTPAPGIVAVLGLLAALGAVLRRR